MPHGTKIATCCYCGARAALVLGEGRHELSCSSCAAPLHDLKRLPEAAVAKHRDNPRLPAKPKPRERKHEPRRRFAHASPPKPKKKSKKRKSFGRWFLEEAFDKIEDIFD